jgi:transcriptional regulator with XRE-family HTH domain
MSNSQIGAMLRTLRIAAGLKACWVATELGIPRSLLSMLENGKRNWRPERIEQYRRIVQQ